MSRPYSSYDYGQYAGGGGYTHGYTNNPALSGLLQSTYDMSFMPNHAARAASPGGHGGYPLPVIPYFGGGPQNGHGYDYNYLYGATSPSFGGGYDGQYTHPSANMAFYYDFINPVMNRAVVQYQEGMNLVQPGSFYPAVDSPEIQSSGGFGGQTPVYDTPAIQSSGSFGDPSGSPDEGGLGGGRRSGGSWGDGDPTWSGGGDDPGGASGGGSSGFGGPEISHTYTPPIESTGVYGDTVTIDVAPVVPTYDSPEVTGSGSFGGQSPTYDSPDIQSSGGFGSPVGEPQWSGGGDEPGGGGGGGSAGFG